MEHSSHHRETRGRQEPEENLFDARGTESKQEWPNLPTGQAGAKPKTERQPLPRSAGQAPTDADTNDIFKHNAHPRTG